MKESDYILTTDLVKISNAKTILSDIIPENSDIIDKDEMTQIMILLTKWETDSYSKLSDELPENPYIIKDLDFGDIVRIEQNRYGADNEMYGHKVINKMKSNSYVDVPVVGCAENKLHRETVDVISCICCGVSEEKVFKYRVCDVERIEKSKESK